MRPRPLPALSTLAMALGVALFGPTARAGDVSILSAAAVKAPIEAAATASEAAIGERLVATFGTAGAVRDRVAGGDTVDIVVLPPARLDELVRQGVVAADGREPLGTVRLGLAVKVGGLWPAIATEADVRAALLAAPSIGLADPSAGATTGVFFAKLLRDMGLSEALKARIRLFPDGTAAMVALARGEVALAMGQISEIRPVAGADLVGPLPGAMQLRTVYAAGVSTRSTKPVAARAVIAFLRSPGLAPAFAAAGFDPPGAVEP